ncbi:MAG TPA: hypothetical protein VGR10_02170 [Thermoleophilaceae bacterium]|nr:hypothetical protein [Thermoleophilaceae bacterium]
MSDDTESRTSEDEQGDAKDQASSAEQPEDEQEESGADQGEEEAQATGEEGGADEGEKARASGEDSDSSEGSEGEGESDAAADEEEQVKQEMEQIEDDPPRNLDDWPQGKAKYETFGGPEGEHGYHEGPETKLGPSSLRHHEGGDVSIEGEKVDDPEEYKGEPVPGGPTDPNSPDQAGEREKEQGDE